MLLLEEEEEEEEEEQQQQQQQQHSHKESGEGESMKRTIKMRIKRKKIIPTMNNQEITCLALSIYLSRFDSFTNLGLYIYIYIPTPCAQAGCDTRSFFSVVFQV